MIGTWSALLYAIGFNLLEPFDICGQFKHQYLQSNDVSSRPAFGAAYPSRNLHLQLSTRKIGLSGAVTEEIGL
jgi:hypothetical protein